MMAPPTLSAWLIAPAAMLLALWAGPAASATESGALAEAEAAARQAMDDFLGAFNDRDEAAWADTLVYPHVRIASGQVLVYPDRRAFVEAMDLSRFAEESGWDHSTWDDMKIVQRSPDKVHIAVSFTRYDAEGAQISSFESLYVVEKVNGRWGIRARSSFAP